MNAQERFEIDPEEPVYVIGVVSRLVGLPVWTLRMLDREGIVKATRNGDGRNRMYCLNDLQKLRYVGSLLLEQHVNIHGVKIILQREGWDIYARDTRRS